jgi:hypothetical protein
MMRAKKTSDYEKEGNTKLKGKGSENMNAMFDKKHLAADNFHKTL